MGFGSNLLGKIFKKTPEIDAVGNSGGSNSGTDGVILLPENILENAVLGQLSGDQAVLVHLTFSALDAEKEYERINGTYHRWADHENWGHAGGEPKFFVSMMDTRLEIGFAGVPHPALPIQNLVAAYKQSGLPLEKVFVSVVTLDEDGSPEPHGEEIEELPDVESCEDEEDFWKRSFDLSTTPPDTEDPDGMFAVMTMESGALVSEYRPFTLYFQDVRIVYGLGNVEDESTNERCATLLAALRSKCTAYFTKQELESIVIMDKDGGENQHFDRIRHEGRIGYSFALGWEAISAFTGSHCRFMEYEFMAALRDLIREQQLQPTIHWDRDQVYIFNLWEK